jgi:kynurenine formamidase
VRSLRVRDLLRLATTIAITIGSAGAQAQDVNDAPFNEKSSPTEWGADDKVGAPNRTTPELVLKAVGLVKQGKVATLGKIYAADAPAFGTRSWKLVIPGMPTGGPFGGQKLVYNDEYVATELGQIGTQFDGPGHIGVITSKGMFYYNGRFLSDKGISAAGLGPLGVEHVGQKGFVCRGVLLDAVALRGGQLPIPKENSASDPGIVTAKDVEEMVKRQGIAPIGLGDCEFLHTGIWHPKDWDTYDAAEKVKRVAQFNAGEPGFGISACEYLAERKIMLTGADTWAVEAIGKDAGGETPQPFECHIKMQTKRGIWNLENLTQLVADKAYEFLFVWSPLKMKGATGSPGNPIALY